MEFNPMNFIDNLQYMGFGMLGILAVMSVIIGSIYVLGAIFGRNKDDRSEK